MTSFKPNAVLKEKFKKKKKNNSTFPVEIVTFHSLEVFFSLSLLAFSLD